VDLRQLRYFLAVAEDLHFTRAAQRMHVAQPALSAQIRGLEREVGGPLLDRSTRNVRLTEAGEALAAEALQLVRAADHALAEARSVARRESQRLAIGCLGAPGDFLAEALDALAARVPEAQVDVRTLDFVALWAALAAGEVDLALAYLPADLSDFGHLSGIGELEVIGLVDERRVVVLSATHELAQRDLLRPADLAQETFVTHPDAVPESWRDFWLLTEQLGRRPAVHEVTADSVDQWLHLIERGRGIDTCPAYVARYYSWPSISYVPLVDAPLTTLAVLRRRRSQSPLASTLLAAVRDAALSYQPRGQSDV
jgi:LysR family transcriptional regulator, benzoate and cis,cis-muconate-responsive activator of ben and cat genes